MIMAPSTIAELVSPLTEAEFLTLLRERKFAFRPGSGAARYAPLVGWPALRQIVESRPHPNKRDGIRVIRESYNIPSDRWMTGGKVDGAKLDAFLADGFSVVVLNIEAFVPALAAICNEIKSKTREYSYVGAVVTSGTNRGAFKLHFDPEDLIILQVDGTKRWQIFGPPVASPVRGMPKQPLPEPEPIFDEVLEPGDLLFVPAGNWHHCESGLSTSVHLGVFIIPPTGWHAVNDLIQPLLSDETFRAPLTRLEGAAGLDMMETEVKNRLIEKIGNLKLGEFIAAWNGMASTRRPPE